MAPASSASRSPSVRNLKANRAGRLHIEQFTIAERFCGPPRSGNGGYVCGRIARHLPGTVAVRLKAPPPLNIGLRLETAGEEARLFHDTTLIGEGRRGQLDLKIAAAPTLEQARLATRSFLGFKTHPFPGCFVCGTARNPQDGLRIFPGAVNGSSTIAAPWTPDASLADEWGMVKSEFLWSALDCTGGFAAFPPPDGSAFVLGELCVSITGEIRAGDTTVMAGWPLGVDGRKRFVGSAVYSSEGRTIAFARAVWIEVPLSAWS
jgi:hypothetical protein